MRQGFAKNKKKYDSTMATLKNILDKDFYLKLIEMNMDTSRKYHRLHLTTHQKKFRTLTNRYNVPYLNPYDSLSTFDITQPTFSGLFQKVTPTIKKDAEVVRNTVVNLTDELLKKEETDILSLGLKFAPASDKDKKRHKNVIQIGTCFKEAESRS